MILIIIREYTVLLHVFVLNKTVFLTDGVGGGLLSLLVHTIVPCDSAMSGLSFYCTPIRTHKHAGHHS